MPKKTVVRTYRRKRAHRRVRRKVRGSSDRPRLCVYRSLNHIYAQAIDDDAEHTLAQASSLDKEYGGGSTGGNIAAAKEVGQLIAARLKDQGIEKVVFDRGGYRYMGRVKALAESAREAGLKF